MTSIVLLLFLTFIFGPIMTSQEVSDLSFGENYLKADCENWNATVFIQSDSQKKTVESTFQIFLKYEKCFSHYKVVLHLLWPDSSEFCNVFRGRSIRSKILKRHYEIISHIHHMNFTNLKPGYYCLLLQPCDVRCYEEWTINSDVFRIEDSLKNFNPESPINKQLDNLEKQTVSDIITVMLIATICALLIVTAISGIILYWRCKHSKMKATFSTKLEKDSPLIPSEKTKVYIFYFPDEDTRKKVDILESFLNKLAAHFVVKVIDDRLAESHIDTIAWLSYVLKSCPILKGSCECKKRFIIVMSERVIQSIHSLEKAMEHLNRKKINAERTKSTSSLTSCLSYDDDMQADWFRYGINYILIDWEKCFQDYYHYFVIYFNESSYEERTDVIPIAPSVRFIIPNHLVKLCQDLNTALKDATLEDELFKLIDKHPIKHL